jgi:hypothetical protein
MSACRRLPPTRSRRPFSTSEDPRGDHLATMSRCQSRAPTRCRRDRCPRPPERRETPWPLVCVVGRGSKQSHSKASRRSVTAARAESHESLTQAARMLGLADGV